MADISKIITPDGNEYDLMDATAHSVELTQAQYDQLPSSEKLNGTTYFITDGQNITTASAVSYDNTNSGLTATNVQGAVDEVNEKIAPFTSIKKQYWSDLSVDANNIDTRDLTVTVSANYGMVCGFAITGTSTSAVIQCYFTSKTNLHIRILNTGNYATIYGFTIFYI